MELNFDDTNKPQQGIQEPIVPVSTPPTADNTTDDALGLSEAELNDPNKITVNITDDDAPIIILYGPPSCGKTMTLVRLTRFLQRDGYTVEAERGFRPTYDNHYKELCDNFDVMMNSDDAAKSTSLINFMLVKVYKEGRCLCQILEAPGEYYFSKEEPQAPYPRYFQTIKQTNNRKVWTIIVEPQWENPQDRKNYVTRITQLKNQIRPSDKVVFVYNKIDMTPYVISPGHVNIKEAMKKVKQDYPNLFIPFKNTNPLTKWINEYNCGFVPFQTGDYTRAADGTLVFTEGPDEYPRILWNEIKKQI